MATSVDEQTPSGDDPGTEVSVTVSATSGLLMAQVVKDRLLEAADGSAFTQLVSSLRMRVVSVPEYSQGALRFGLTRAEDGGPPDEIDDGFIVSSIREFFEVQLPGNVTVSTVRDALPFEPYPDPVPPLEPA